MSLRKDPVMDDDEPTVLIDENNIRDMVENCIGNDDITPLLRLLFEAQSIPGSPSVVTRESLTVVRVIQKCLKEVGMEQERCVKDVCHANALEIAHCVKEMDWMNRAVDDVSKAVVYGNAGLQELGSKVVKGSTEVVGLLQVQDNITRVCEAISGGRKVLTLCQEVGRLIEKQQLYQALCLLDKIQTTHLDPLLKILASPTSASSLGPHPPTGPTPPGGPPSAALPRTLSSGSTSSLGSMTSSLNRVSPNPFQRTSLTRLPSLASFSNSHLALLKSTSRHEGGRGHDKLCGMFQGVVSDLTAVVQCLALNKFSDWLVAVRAQARQVGMDAIREAAKERQQSEELLKERKKLRPMLRDSLSLRKVAKELSGSTFRLGLGQESVKRISARRPMNQDALGTKEGPTSKSGAPRPGKVASPQVNKLLPPTPPAPASAPAPYRDLMSLHPGQPFQAVSDLVKKCLSHSLGSDSKGPVCRSSHRTFQHLSGVDMTLLHLCVLIHRHVDMMEPFRQYYLDQRKLQMQTDLQPPTSFLENYQGYLAQVVGFFMIEAYVQRVSDDLLSWAQVGALWDAASAQLRISLEAALDQLTSCNIMLLVKDFVCLVCTALAKNRYQVSPVQEILVESRTRYHELLMASVGQQLNDALEADVLQDFEVANLARHDELVKDLGLPAYLEGASGLGIVPPYVAPYTSSVPQILQLIRSFVLDSRSYLKGLLNPWEVLPAVFLHRDRMLSKVVVDCLAARVHIVNNHDMLQEAMKMLSNIWCLLQAINSLDDWTITHVRVEGEEDEDLLGPPAALLSNGKVQAGMGRAPTTSVELDSRPSLKDCRSPSHGKGWKKRTAIGQDALMSNVHASLRAVQDGAERNLTKLLSGRVSTILEKAKTLDWVPSQVQSKDSSPYVDSVLGYLQETFQVAQRLLPRSSVVELMRGSVKAMGNALGQVLADPSVRAYNLFAIDKLANDVAVIERFVVRWSSQISANLIVEFAEPLQLCNLLLSTTMEDILTPGLRRQRYPALDLGMVVSVMDKYKEVPSQSKKFPHFPTKKAIDALARQLRGQMATSAGPRALEGI